MRLVPALLLCCVLSFAAPQRKEASSEDSKHAKNVIFFLADAGGIPTLNAASIYGYDAPLSLFVQSWPFIGLSNTSPADKWVTDSAAGMTAIVTGQKTHNGVISEDRTARPGVQSGAPLKTLLEYAEEHGLSTGVVTNVSVADATPATCYAHCDDRRKWGEIFAQIFTPRFGDGVDVAIGSGRTRIDELLAKTGQSMKSLAEKNHRPIYQDLNVVPADCKRPIVVSDDEMDVPGAAQMALKTLGQNSKGYFLMIEWDCHTDHLEKGLSHVVNFDKLIKKIASQVDLNDTLLLFTADHSFGLRLNAGGPGAPLLSGLKEAKQDGKTITLPAISVQDTHTGEEVMAAAQGAGAAEVHGIFPNTHLFQIMKDAFGW